MGKNNNGPKLPTFCLNRIRPLVRVRSPPTTTQSKPEAIPARTEHKSGDDSCGGVVGNSNNVVEEKANDHHFVGEDNNNKKNNNNVKQLEIGRRIMIVVDSSFEAKGALQWALSHSTVQSQDKLVLLHVTKSPTSKQGKVEELSKERAPGAYELVNSLRNMCQSKRPEVEIEVVVVEGKEKGPTIVEAAKKQSVAMLILGQKKRSSTTWRLLMMWAGQRVAGSGGVAEYCIQNADCLVIAVRRKNRRHGGYLITTKRHKDFWLLA